MSKRICTMRLDEILIKEGLVTESQVKEALLRQKAHGGKFGSQLLYHRYIDESGLVKALTMQFGCEGVILSKLEIPDIILNFIPKKVALVRKVIPFDYNPEKNILKVACEDPCDTNLLNELEFIARGKVIKLYVAAELVLNTVIAKYYLGRDLSLDDNLLLEIPEEATETGRVKVITDFENKDKSISNFVGEVLLVTDEEFSAPLMQGILERENYQVTITDSADDAIDIIGDKQFHTVFIKDTVAGDYIDLIDRLRKTSPRTIVRYYESAANLLVNDEDISTEEELLLKNLNLFTSLLSAKEKLSTNHSSIVGQYVEKLCKQMGLPPKERIKITNAGYLHDLAKFYYSSDDTNKDPRETICYTVKLLKSLNYSPIIIEMLKCMYKDLGGKFTKRLPIEALGGNILTMIDLFCDNIPNGDKISLDKFDAIKRKFRDLTGKLFLREVVESFIVMMQEQILTGTASDSSCQVMIYSLDPGIAYPLELRVKNEGFRSLIQTTPESFVELYERSKPDIIILMLPSDTSNVHATANDLISRGIDFKESPTFILSDFPTTSHVTELFDKGIEDVIDIDSNLDLLIVKMKKIRTFIEEKRQLDEAAKQSSRTNGRLADMNLIDLLQALGPSQKTAKITLTSNNDPAHEMEIYLNKGQIAYAKYKGDTGAEAIYGALGWTDGVWVVEPILENNLPEPNNNRSNETIMMEGCRLLDEKVRAGNLF